jgi:two-component system phosphate regulon sensor histidine kinase PhoR
MKVRSPREVAFFSSLILSLVLVIFISLFQWYNHKEIDFVFLSVFFITSLIIDFFVVFFFIERFLNGKLRLIYRTIYSLRSDEKDEKRIGMGDDVLGSVNREVQTWANQKGAEIKKLKDQEAFRREFLGNLAHELKTPIFSIQGYILTLLEGGLDDEKINRDFLERASRGVDRISHIIEDLDTINNLESGRIELNLKRFNIVELTHEILGGLDKIAEPRQRTMKFDDDYGPIYVMADKGRISQVITNLVANSINYGNEGGTTEIRFTRMDDKLLVEVADDGPGIEKEHISRLFERFYRIDRSRSRHQGGSGLGLAIVKHIIEAHKQSISVQSTPGVGSVFSFTLQRSKKLQAKSVRKS